MKEHRLLSHATFVVIDLETSGASPHRGAGITEIGAVKVCGGVVIEEFESFINPMVPIPEFITHLTGITDEMVMGAPQIGEIFPSLIEFIGPAQENILVAHNAPFDMSFLKASAVALDLAWPPYRVIDTVRYSRKVVSKEEVGDYKLGTLAEFFGARTSPTHRALDDARATVDVLHAVLERFGDRGIFTVEGLLK
jgi:DNA polymerase-3 subunit epsilon